MAKVTRKLEQLENLNREIEEAKEKIHSDFGKELISELDIDYDILDRKKDIKEAVQIIIAEMNSNPFLNEVEENEIVENEDSLGKVQVNSYEQQNP